MKNENQWNIVAASLYDFLVEMQKAVQAGYILSDKNEHFPQGFVSLYTATSRHVTVTPTPEKF